MELRHTLIFIELLVAAIVTVNTSACNPPVRTASSTQQAKQIFEVYADRENNDGYD
jgi:hypothetical protein